MGKLFQGDYGSEVGNLRATYGVAPPFSILNGTARQWQDRKARWAALGIQSELGRDAKASHIKGWIETKRAEGMMAGNYCHEGISIFDPVLCELAYSWWCPPGGTILDPFAGGSVRGIVASHLGYKYTGVELRPEQVDSNRAQANSILPPDNQPNWVVGDSRAVLPTLPQAHMIFTCPPYGPLEKYSDRAEDLSNMSIPSFFEAYRDIIHKAYDRLAPGGFAVYVVGEVRARDGGYIGLVPRTIDYHMELGGLYYNEAVLMTSLASAALRAGGNMKSKKLVKVHQNVLVFMKPPAPGV